MHKNLDSAFKNDRINNNDTYNSKYHTEVDSSGLEEQKQSYEKQRYSLNVSTMSINNPTQGKLAKNNSGTVGSHQHHKSYDQRSSKNRYSQQPQNNYKQYVGDIGSIHKTMPCK
jgi:hypothetical protein